MIADGVGGWNNQGIDPSKFSRFLAKRFSMINLELVKPFIKIKRYLSEILEKWCK